MSVDLDMAKKKQEIVPDEIDSILEEVGLAQQNQETEEQEESILTDIHVKDSGEVVDLDDDNSIATAIIKNSFSVIADSKKVFTHFSDDVFVGKDRSEASKDMLIRSLEVQNGANQNLIALAKVLQAKKLGNNGTNIQINTLAPKSAKINMSNIKSEMFNE